MSRIVVDSMTEEEATDLHEQIASSLRQLGLKGHSLDTALSSAFKSAVIGVHTDRKQKEARKSKISLVAGIETTRIG